MHAKINAQVTAYTAISSLILSGKLKPGRQLVQRDLARRIGITTTPVREALRRLEAEGILETIPNWGTRVRALDETMLYGETVVRRAVECEAAYLCSEHAKEEELRYLCDIGRRCDAVTCQAPPDTLFINKLDYEFHHRIVLGSHCRELEREFQRVQIIRNFCHLVRKELPISGMELLKVKHAEIAEAIRERNAQAAWQSMRNHINHAYEVIIRFFREKSFK